MRCPRGWCGQRKIVTRRADWSQREPPCSQDGEFVKQSIDFRGKSRKLAELLPPVVWPQKEIDRAISHQRRPLTPRVDEVFRRRRRRICPGGRRDSPCTRCREQRDQSYPGWLRRPGHGGGR